MTMPQVLTNIPKGLAVIVDPDEKDVVTVPKELFAAVDCFIRERKTGSVTIQFKTGGVAGVETVTRQIYK